MIKCIIDVETNNLSWEIGKIIELSCITFDNQFKILNKFSSMINQYDYSGDDYKSYQINGIKDEDLKHAPLAPEVRTSFIDFLNLESDKYYVFGWNYKVFDLRFLELFLGIDTYKDFFYYKAYDVDQLALDMISVGKIDLSLEDLTLTNVARVLDIPHHVHNAYGDCLATLRVYEKLLKMFW